MFRRVLMVGSAAVLVATALPASSSLAAAVGDPVPLASAALAVPPNPEMLAAMRRDQNLSADGAMQRLGREEAAHAIDERVRKLASSGYAGSWLADDATVLKVGVTRRSLIAPIRAAGATPVLMRYSLSELEAASARLKSVPFPGQSLTSWGVDLPTNRVLITHLPDGRTAAEMFAAAGHVDAAMVRYETRSRHSVGTAEIFAGRRNQNERTEACTLGFAVQPVDAGGFGFLTAGHCGRPGSPVFKQGGDPLGVTSDSTYFGPSGAPDHGWIRVTNGDTTQPKVFISSPNPRLEDVLGSRRAMPGELVCRVGSVSFPSFACGPILRTGINPFLRYTTGATDRTVGGLTEMIVCSTPGDSGGPVLTPMGQAQGTIVGVPVQGESCESSPRGTSMYFQPIGDTLFAYGLKLFMPPQPPPLRISSVECGPEQTGPGQVCRATWVGGKDPAVVSWQVYHPRPTPYVETDARNHITEAHFACFFDEAEPSYQATVVVRDALGAEASWTTPVCIW